MLVGEGLQLLDGDCAFDGESAGFGSAEGEEVSAATEFLADVVGVSADVEAFATEDAEIDFVGAAA